MDRFYMIRDEKRRPYKEDNKVLYFKQKSDAKDKRNDLINSNKKNFTVSTGPDHPKRST